MPPLFDIERLEARLAADPHSPVFAQLADAYRKQGSFEKAIQICQRGMDQHPNYASAHMVLGRTHKDKGDLPAAREAFERVIHLDPENVLAYRFLGELAEARHASSEALASYRSALILRPFDKTVRAAIERLQPQAEETLKPAPPEVAKAPPEPSPPETAPLATETLAGLYASQGLYDRAADMYARLVAETPDREDLAEKYREVLCHLKEAGVTPTAASLGSEEAVALLEAWRDGFQSLTARRRGPIVLLEAWRAAFQRLKRGGRRRKIQLLEAWRAAFQRLTRARQKRGPIDLLQAWREAFQKLRAVE